MFNFKLAHLFAGAAFSFTALSASALSISGFTNAHDPSAIVKDDDTYFYYTTGEGGAFFNSSTSLTNWNGPIGHVLGGANTPEWIADHVPENNGGDNLWAPDVIQMGDYYYLYYSVSSFGSQQSGIGVARATSLKEQDWEDLGPVVKSYESDSDQTDFNAIDPALFRDDDGRVYMSYGSFFGGIALVEIDPETGLLLNPEEEPQKIYGGNFEDIEAPYIIREGDYYYLYFNKGKCCDGLDSTYEIQVAWSENITGPYEGAYTILENDTGTRHVGPGHIGLLEEDGCQYISTHYYDRQSDGFARVDILALGYDASNMPFLTRDFTPGECSALTPEEEPAPDDTETDEPDPDTDEETEEETPSEETPSSGSSGGSSGGAFGFVWLLALMGLGVAARRRG